MKNNIKIAFLFVILSQVVGVIGQDSVGFYYNAALPYVKYLPALGLAGAGLYTGGRYAAPYVKYLPAFGLAGAGLYAGGKYATQRLGDSFNNFLNTISAMSSPDFSRIANVFSTFKNLLAGEVQGASGYPVSEQWVAEFEQAQKQKPTYPLTLTGEVSNDPQAAELVKEFEQAGSSAEATVQSISPQPAEWIKEFISKNKTKLLSDFDTHTNKDNLINQWEQEFESELASQGNINKNKHRFLGLIFDLIYRSKKPLASRL